MMKYTLIDMKPFFMLHTLNEENKLATKWSLTLRSDKLLKLKLYAVP